MRGAVLVVVLGIVLGTGATAAADEGGLPVSEHELGARLGMRVNAGGIAPGGLDVGGVFQEQLTDEIWLELGAHLAFGGNGHSCYLARDLGTTCDPAVASGAGAQLLAGGRWYFLEHDRFLFSAAAGGGVGLATFRGDNLIGFGVPLYVAAGGRTRVAEKMAASCDLVLSTGATIYDRGQGLEPFVAISVLFGIDFAL